MTLPRWLLITLIIASGAGIILYHIFRLPIGSDEAAHLLTGLEYLQQEDYRYERLHPPLARAIAALPMHLQGKKAPVTAPCSSSFAEFYNARLAEGAQGMFPAYCLHPALEQFQANLTASDLRLPRLVILGFYIIACLAFYRLANAFFPAGPSVFALLIFAHLPPVIWFSGFVMLDIPLLAALLLTCLAWLHLLQRPHFYTALAFGLMLAVCILIKYSALLWLPLLCGAFLWINRRSVDWALRWWGFAGAVAFAAMWAAFDFSLSIPANVIPPLKNTPADWATQAWLPLGEVWQGIYEIVLKNARGHTSPHWQGHLFAHADPAWYYPFSLLVSLPFVALLMTLLGTSRWRTYPTVSLFILLIAMLLTVMPSQIQVNLHHILPIYIPVCLLAAQGAAFLSRRASGQLVLELIGVFYLLTASTHFIAPKLIPQHSLQSRWIGETFNSLN